MGVSIEQIITKAGEIIPKLNGKIYNSDVIYEESSGKTYITLYSTVIVEEKEYWELQKLISLFYKYNIVLRITYPRLKESFLKDPNQYSAYIIKYLNGKFDTSLYGDYFQKQFIIDRSDPSKLEDGVDGKLEFLIPEYNYMRIDKKELKSVLADFVYNVFDAKVQIEIDKLEEDESRWAPEPEYEDGQLNPYGTIDAGDGYVDDDGVFYEY